MKSALARGALLLDIEAVWITADAFMAEIADMPEAESRAVIDYIGQDDATQRRTWDSLHTRMAGRHGGPLVSPQNRRRPVPRA